VWRNECSNSEVQSYKFLLPLTITVILGFGPRRDPRPYFCSFHTFACFKMGLPLEEGSDYFWSFPLHCGVTLTLAHSLSPLPPSYLITLLLLTWCQHSRQHWPYRGVKHVATLSLWLRWVSEPWTLRVTSSTFVKQKRIELRQRINCILMHQIQNVLFLSEINTKCSNLNYWKSTNDQTVGLRINRHTALRVVVLV
jgi:hypothetical protein